MSYDGVYDPRNPRERERSQFGFVVAVCLICCVCLGLVVLVVVLVAASTNADNNGGNNGAAFTCPGFTDLSESQQRVVANCDAGLESAGTCTVNLPGGAFGTCLVTQFTGGTSAVPTGTGQSCLVPVADCVDGCQCLGEEVRVCTRDVQLEAYPGETSFACVATGPAPTPPPNARVCGAFRAASVVAQEESTTCAEPLFAAGICNAQARCVPIVFTNNTDFPGTPGGVTSITQVNDLACASPECTAAGDNGDPCTCLTTTGTLCKVTAIGVTGGEATVNFFCAAASGAAAPPVVAGTKSGARTPLSQQEIAEILGKQV